MSAEVWRAVPDQEGRYEVSDLGRVRSLPRARTSGGILKPHLRNGYPSVTLWYGAQPRHIRIHELVLLAFVGPRPEGAVTRHLDGGRTNNSLSNLAYGTSSQNNRDTVAHGRHNQRSKTCCTQGHDYTPENTAWIRTPQGQRRRCRTCQLRWQAEFRQRRRRAA